MDWMPPHLCAIRRDVESDAEYGGEEGFGMTTLCAPSCSRAVKASDWAEPPTASTRPAK